MPVFSSSRRRAAVEAAFSSLDLDINSLLSTHLEKKLGNRSEALKLLAAAEKFQMSYVGKKASPRDAALKALKQRLYVMPVVSPELLLNDSEFFSTLYFKNTSNLADSFEVLAKVIAYCDQDKSRRVTKEQFFAQHAKIIASGFREAIKDWSKLHPEDRERVLHVLETQDDLRRQLDLADSGLIAKWVQQANASIAETADPVTVSHAERICRLATIIDRRFNKSLGGLVARDSNDARSFGSAYLTAWQAFNLRFPEPRWWNFLTSARIKSVDKYLKELGKPSSEVNHDFDFYIATKYPNLVLKAFTEGNEALASRPFLDAVVNRETVATNALRNWGRNVNPTQLLVSEILFTATAAQLIELFNKKDSTFSGRAQAELVKRAKRDDGEAVRVLLANKDVLSGLSAEDLEILVKINAGFGVGVESGRGKGMRHSMFVSEGAVSLTSLDEGRRKAVLAEMNVVQLLKYAGNGDASVSKDVTDALLKAHRKTYDAISTDETAVTLEQLNAKREAFLAESRLVGDYLLQHAADRATPKGLAGDANKFLVLAVVNASGFSADVIRNMDIRVPIRDLLEGVSTDFCPYYIGNVKRNGIGIAGSDRFVLLISDEGLKVVYDYPDSLSPSSRGRTGRAVLAEVRTQPLQDALRRIDPCFQPPRSGLAKS